MNEKVDKNFREWLEKIASEWDLPIEKVVEHIIDNNDISNRVKHYPEVSAALSTSPFDLPQFINAVSKCWVMKAKIDGIRFNNFVSNSNQADTLISQFIKNFPEDDENASKRIDKFIKDIVPLGFITPSNGNDSAGAASLASLILTSLYPSRFVDFRRGRWKKFAKDLGYEQLPPNTSHGYWIVWAGKFARTICETKTYKEFYSQTELYSNPLWIIAGICWIQKEPEPLEKPSPEDLEKIRLSLPTANSDELEKRVATLLKNPNLKEPKGVWEPEREEQTRSVYKRDPKVKAWIIKNAKEKCECCGDDGFIKEDGSSYLEVHHLRPLTENGSDTPQNSVALCANCHRKLHYAKDRVKIREALIKRINRLQEAD